MQPNPDGPPVVAGPSASHILVLACGNSLRRDDGAGLLLAAQLVRQWRSARVAVRHVSVHQWTPELAAEIAAPETTAVIFVDAAVCPDTSTIHVQPVQATATSHNLGHHLTPATLLLYARDLYNRQPPARLVTIPGADFALGEEISLPVRQLLDTAPRVAQALLPWIYHPQV